MKRTLKLTVEELENGNLKYDIVADGFKRIEIIGILNDSIRIVSEKVKDNEQTT